MKKFSAIVLLIISLVAPCQAVVVNLTSDSLGLASGNYGASLTIDNFLEITAVTHIGQADEGAGTVYLDIDGLGVQTARGQGPRAISGNSSHQDEALVFDFAQDAAASSLEVGLRDYYIISNPIITLTLADGGEISFSESHPAWNSAVTYTGLGRGTVSLGVLLGPGFDEAASRLTVTETMGNIFVNGISYEVSAVPEPATLALLGLGCLTTLPLKRK